jgi:hypothetical protein
MDAGLPLADGRPGARGHVRRVRGARRRHHLAGGRPPPGRSPSLRLGVQRLPAGEPDRDRDRGNAGRPGAARAPDARRPCPVRPRPGHRRDRADDAGSGGGQGGAGPRRGGRARGGLRGDLPLLRRGFAAENVRRALHRLGGARPDRAGHRRPRGRGGRLALGLPRPAAAGGRGWGAGGAGLATRSDAGESGHGRGAVPGRAGRGGGRRHGACGAQLRRRARGRRGRYRRRRPARRLNAPSDPSPVPLLPAGAGGHDPQPVAADLLLLRWRRVCPVCDRHRPARPDDAGGACPDGVDPDLDGRIVGAGPLHRPVGSSPSRPARRVPGRPRPRRDVRRAPAVGASRAGDRGLGVGWRGDRHRLRSAVGDHARARRSGRGGPGDFGPAAVRRPRSGHRHRSGGGHRGRHFPHRARPWGRAGVLVRYRGRAHRDLRRSMASRSAHVPWITGGSGRGCCGARGARCLRRAARAWSPRSRTCPR